MRKKQMKQLTACGLAIAMLGTGLAGCSSAPKETQTPAAKEEQSETVQEKEEKPAEETAAEKEEPVKLLWLGGTQTQEADPDAEIVKRVNERFNVDLNGFYVGAKNYQENLNVRFAGGELPDVMVIDTPALLSTYVEGGIVGELPIEVIREKAPNFAEACDKYDDGSLWSTMIYNGKNYGVANPSWVVPMAMIWNKNWLDNLGLEVPETLEEYEQVLTAFVKNDPDGNGKDDTAGLSIRSFGAIFGAFGLRCVTGNQSGFTVEEMQLGEDNVPFFPYIRPEAKEALAVLRDWYEKGIIDMEFVTGENHGGYVWLSHPFMNGKIGLTSAQPSHYLIYNTDTSDENNYGLCFKEMKALDPNAEIVMGPAPVGPDGKSGTEAWGKLNKLTCLTTQATSDPRKVDAFLAMLDAYYTDPEYMKMTNYGIEGKHYKQTEHGPVRLIEGAELRKDGVLLCDFGATIPYAENITPEKKEFGESVTGNGYYRFCAPTTEEFSEVIATLDTLTEQAYFDIITGEKPLDYFDTFVKEFKAAGGEAAEKSVQKVYAENLAAVEK